MMNSVCDALIAAFGRPERQAARADRLLARPDASPAVHARAARLHVRAARAGHPAAASALGRAYLFGRGVPGSLASALRWLTQAATDGDAAAQTLLAKLALIGVTRTPPGLFDPPAPLGPADWPAALRWAEAATDSGSAEAQALLAFVREAGPRGMRDKRLAEKLYRRSAEAGCAQGKVGLALALLRRGRRLAEARDLLREAAAAGQAAAHHALALLSVADPKTPPADAIPHFRAAAEIGHGPSQLCLGLALLDAGERHEAESWLRRAALGGDVAAAALLGDLYARAGDLPPNLIEAAMWWRRAAEAGHAGSAAALGRLHLRGPRPNVEEALIWLRDAAKRGDQTAKQDLAALHAA
jgi:TPR repeat protein